MSVDYNFFFEKKIVNKISNFLLNNVISSVEAAPPLSFHNITIIIIIY
jgi:hypothetical protein